MNSTALIAGAGAAGAATAAALLGRGWDVIVVDRRLDVATAATYGLDTSAASAQAVECDLLDLTAVADLRASLIGSERSVDAVVHLVGGWRGSATLDAESFGNWIALSPPIVGTLAALTAVFGPDVRDKPQGRVVMVSSTSTAAPTAGNIAYAAAKSAAEAWMAGVADYFRGGSAAAVTFAVKALLTDEMIARDPDKSFAGYTHVDTLAAAIAGVCTGRAGNGAKIDLTAPEDSR